MLLMFFNINAQKGQKGNYFQIVEEKEAEFQRRFAQKSSLSKEEIKKLEKEFKKYERWRWFWETRVDHEGNFNSYNKEIFSENSIQSLKNSRQTTSRNVNASWNIVGPQTYPTGSGAGLIGIGRIDAITVNPNNSSHVIIGARNGGIWETYDINATNVVWNCLTNDLPAGTVNDLEIVNNTLYASTSSEHAFGGQGETSYGFGVIHKSLTSNEWFIPKEHFQSNNMAISASDPRVIYSAGKKSVHKSTDGGVTWEKLPDPITGLENSRLLIEHVEVNPLNSNVAVVSGRLSRWDSTPDNRYNILVFKTVDGGRTWENLTDTIESVINSTITSTGASDELLDLNKLINGDNTPHAFASYNYNGTLYLALRTYRIPSAPYPSLENRYQFYFIKADGAWNNFELYNSLGSNNWLGYGTDAQTTAFQVVNNDEIIIGNRKLRVIKNPTHTVNILDYPHPYVYIDLHQDIRSVHYMPSLGRLLVGTDGSIHKSFDSNNDLNFTSFPNLAGNLNLFLAFNMGYINSMGTRTIRIGNQDTGWYRTDHNGFSWSTWTRSGPYSEGQVYSDPVNPNVAYFNQTRTLRKTTSGGGSGSSTGVTLSTYTKTPLEVSPHNNNHLVFDNNSYHTPADNWYRYSLSLSNNQVGSFYNISNGISDLDFGRNTAIDISKGNSSTVYVSRSLLRFSIDGVNNTIYKSTNFDFNNPGAITYTNLTGNLNAFDPDILTKAFINTLETDDADLSGNKVWVGFGNLEEGKKVYYSSNGGLTWQNISGNLPNMPVNTLEYDSVNQTLYAGTDFGVYYYNNSTGLWARYGEGLPVAIVTTIAIDNIANEIIASTHGRSVWTAPLMTTPCNDRIVTSTEVWLTDVDICGDLIIQNGGWVRSHARIKANNIIIQGGGKLNSETGEITSNHHNTTSENLNTDIFVESSAEINLAAATVNSFNINVESGANIFIIPPRGGFGTTTLNHSRINVFDGGTYNHSTFSPMVLNDRESTVNLFDDFNFGAFGYATKVDAVPFSGEGSLNVIDLSDIYIQSESLINNSKYRWDSDTSIFTGRSVDPNPFLPKGDFDTNNADVILKAKQSITLDVGTIIETDSFIAFIDGEDLTNFNRNAIAEEEEKEAYPIDKYDEIQEITTKIVESVSVYPNPATSFLQIKLNDETMQGSDVILRDVAGNILKKISLEKDGARIDLSSFKKGVYLIHFSKGSKKLFKRVIKL